LNIAIVTLFPEMFAAITEYGITGRAVASGIINVHCVNPRSFTEDRHQTVDDRPYGGGPGMVMKVQPLKLAIQEAKRWIAERSAEPLSVIYMSPQGRQLCQAGVVEIAARRNLVLVSGRYEGIDERLIIAEVDEEWSIGDYVLSGGELPAMVLIDALTRQLPGALGCSESVVQDSFVGGLLDCPHYTRPLEYDGVSVPLVLLSGDHKKIDAWRRQQSLGRTWQRRPDLLEKMVLDAESKALLRAFQEEHLCKQ
jgi:tRNA (guanine37-N1)-methyltransferase